MSRPIVCNIMSLDGYTASTEGNPLVLPMDAAFDSDNLQRLRAADALLLGANSYRMFMGFWPAQATNPEAGDVHRELGEIYNRIPTIMKCIFRMHEIVCKKQFGLANQNQVAETRLNAARSTVGIQSGSRHVRGGFNA